MTPRSRTASAPVSETSTIANGARAASRGAERSTSRTIFQRFASFNGPGLAGTGYFNFDAASSSSMISENALNGTAPESSRPFTKKPGVPLTP